MKINKALIFVGLVAASCVTDEHDADIHEAPLEIEHEAQMFELVGPVVEHQVEPGPDAVVMPRMDGSADVEGLDPLDTWSREELADKLRPVIATGDGIYIAQEPNWTAADAVLDGDAEEFVRDVVARTGNGRPTIEQVAEFRDSNGAVLGSDDRSWVPNTTIQPFNAIVKLHLFTGNTYRGTCSGSYIGPWTFITSAHCLVFSNTDRVNRVILEPARNGNWTPYGSFDCRLDDSAGNNDYLWSVPYGYYYGQNEALDYAVMDTWPCHRAPRWFGGYAVNAGDSIYSNHGYPGGTCPWAPGPDNYQCGMSGFAYINEWRMESAIIDTTGGQSGSPWYRMYDIHRPVGVHRGYREYFDFARCGFDVCRRNYARRIDTAFSNFISAISYDY